MENISKPTVKVLKPGDKGYAKLAKKYSNRCPCLCHELSENPGKHGIKTHASKCICSGGDGFTEI